MSPEVIRNLHDAWRWSRTHPWRAGAALVGSMLALIGLALVQRSGYATAVVSALLRVLAGALVLLHQVLLEPDRRNYPDGRPRLRIALFVFGLMLIANGGDVLYRAIVQMHRTPPGSALEFSLALFVAEALRLEKVLRSWLPARTQRRIQQLLHLASCRNRDAVAKARASSDAAVGRERPQTIASPARVSGAVVPAALAELAMQGSGDTVVGPDEHPPTTFGDALRTAFPLPPTAADDPVIPLGLRDA